MNWLILVGVLAGLYGLHRLALWLEKKGWLFYLHNKPSPDSLGRAALEMQQMLQPEKRFLLEVKQKQRAEREDQGGPDTAGEGTAGGDTTGPSQTDRRAPRSDRTSR